MTRVEWSCMRTARPWAPPVNAYRCPDRFVVCVDLAGVTRESIHLEIQPRQLLLRGERPPPGPTCDPATPPHVLAMEIDYGPFERIINLTADVHPPSATAEQRNGFLWIFLPFPPQQP